MVIPDRSPHRTPLSLLHPSGFFSVRVGVVGDVGDVGRGESCEKAPHGANVVSFERLPALTGKSLDLARIACPLDSLFMGQSRA